MIKNALSLYMSLLLAAGPAAAQVHDAANAGRAARSQTGTAGLNSATAAGVLPGLPVASAGLSASLSPAVAPVVAAVEAAAARPEGLRALAADASPAAAYARALIAAPVSPAARAEAVKALGEPAVARLEGAVRALKSEAASSAKSAAALKSAAAEFAALDGRALEDRVPEASPVAGRPSSVKSALAAPARAWRAVKRAAAMATMAVTLSMTVAAPMAVAQNAAAPAGFNPVVVMAQAGAVQTQDAIVRANEINDAIAKWTPNTRLIVMGDPGLDAAAQRQLAAFLADKHWTVIVVESAAGMTYRDVDGNLRRGVDALEYGAGQGIFRKGGFSSQVESLSGLPDGSILVISMNEHFLFLRNSEAQRVNGLDGAAHFPGDLDQWAQAATSPGPSRRRSPTSTRA